MLQGTLTALGLMKPEILSNSAAKRIERRLRSGEERMARAFETLTKALEGTRDGIDRETPSPSPRQSIAAGEQLQAVETHDLCIDLSLERPALDNRSDERLEEIARRIVAARKTAEAGKSSSDANVENLHVDLRAAVSQIALRRQALDARDAHRMSAAAKPAPTVGPTPRSDCEAAPGRSPADLTRAEVDLGADAQRVADKGADLAVIPKRLAEAPYEDTGGLRGKSEQPCRGQDQRLCATDLTAMREGIAAMNRSLADLAPRNAVVALDGAVRDLTDRVAVLRQLGERESLLAPLDAMASELRASLKLYDPHTVVAGLEREISALAGRIEILVEAAINPETFKRIQQQTEEVRNLLAAAATRSVPLERLERQIADLADRVERLGASPTPQVESAQMAASLADLRREIERATPPSTLSVIERRLEQIAARLDDEVFRPAQKADESYTLGDLARRIDEVHQTLEAGRRPQADTSALEASLKNLSAKGGRPSSEPLAAHMREIGDKLLSASRRDANAELNAIEPMLAEIIDKVDRLSHAEPPSLQSIERLLQSLDAKLDFGAERPFGREIIGRIADEVAQRLEKDYPLWVEAQPLSHQIAYVRDRLEALSDLEGMQALMRKLSVQLANFSSEAASDDDDATPSLAGRARAAASSTPALRGIDALEALDSSISGGLRPFRPSMSTSEDDPSLALSAGHEVLLEPGAGKPNNLREARESTRDTESITNPTISSHIAAARRAAHSALSEGAAINVPAAAPGVGRGIERAKALYATHRRSVLVVAAFAIVAVAALRLISVHAPIVERSQLSGQPAKTADARASSGKPGDVLVAPPPGPLQVDTTPTASIVPLSEAAKASFPTGTTGQGLSAAISTALPTSLRDAVVAGSSAAQYELAQRLFEGRGVPQDQQAAAIWFERAAAAGLAPAQFRLGTLYSKGVGVQRDPAAAKRWYAKAAEAGNARAAHNLAVMYSEPAGETPDYVEAAKWFRKAADLGVRDSEFNLAILYARGLGVDQDFRRSWLFFSLAAAQGDADAAKKRDEVAAKMAPDALAAAADDLAKFKVSKSDPAANEAPPPPGGWDGKSSVPPLSQKPTPPGGASPIPTP